MVQITLCIAASFLYAAEMHHHTLWVLFGAKSSQQQAGKAEQFGPWH